MTGSKTTMTFALVWELWRLGRRELLIRVSSQCLVLCTFVYFLTDAAMMQFFRGLALFLMLLINAISWLGILDNTRYGFGFRLGFMRPISTLHLVAVPMGYLVGASAASYVIPALIVNLFGLQLPVVAPAVLIASIAACLIAAFWSSTTIWGKTFGLLVTFAVVVAMGYWIFVVRAGSDPLVYEMGHPDFLQLQWPHYAVLSGIALTAFVATVRSVTRQRGGEPAFVAALTGSLPRLRSQRFARRGPFRSPWTAQCWFELQRCGYKLLLCAFVVALLCFVAASSMTHFSPHLRDGSAALWIVALSIAPIVYQIMGIEWSSGIVRRNGVSLLSLFDATRSLRNDQMIAAKVLVVSACTVAGWLTMALAAAAHTAFFSNWQSWRPLQSALQIAAHELTVGTAVAALFGLALTVISFTTATIAFSYWSNLHVKMMTAGFVVTYLHVLAGIADATHEWSLQPYWDVCAWGLAATVCVMTIWVLNKTLRQNSLGLGMLMPVAICWIVQVLTVAGHVPRLASMLPQAPLSARVVGLAALVGPMFAVAAAPLALALHRHK